jgi:hypothetical protein
MPSGSFHHCARQVRDSQRKIYGRRSALMSCIRLFCDGSGSKYTGMKTHLDNRFGFYSIEPPEPERLLAVLNVLEITRNQILEARRAFDILRIRQKQRGIPVPRRRDIEALQARIHAIKQAADMLPPPTDNRSE